jgi:hypothetical protein
MHHERPINPLPAGFFPDGVGVRSVAKKGMAIQCEPLTGVLALMGDEPFLFRKATDNLFRGRGVGLGDGHSDVLLLGKSKGFERT